MEEWWVQDEIMRNKLHKNFIVHSLRTLITLFTSQTAERSDEQIIILLIGSKGCVWGKSKITCVCKQSAPEYTYLGLTQRGTSWFIQVIYCCVRLKVFKVTLLNMRNLSDATPSWFINSYLCFEECSAFFLRVKQSKHGDLECMTLKLKAPISFITLVTYQQAWIFMLHCW